MTRQLAHELLTYLIYTDTGWMPTVDMGDVDETTMIPEDDGEHLDIGPEVFDIYSSHLASCLSDENEKLEREIKSLCRFRDFLSTVEIRVDDRTVKLPGLEESMNKSNGNITEIGSAFAFDSIKDVPGIPVSSITEGSMRLYISNQLVVRLPQGVVDRGFERRGGVRVCRNPHLATLMGESETIDLHGRLEGLTEEHEELFYPPSDTWTKIREIPNVTFHPTSVDVGRYFEMASQQLIVSSARDVQVHYNCERLDKTDRETQMHKEQIDKVKQMIREIECIEENADSIDEVACLKEKLLEAARDLEGHVNLRDFGRETLLKLLEVNLDCNIAEMEDPNSDVCDDDVKALHIVFGIAGGRGIGLTKRRVNLKEQVRVLRKIRATVLVGHLHTAAGGFSSIEISEGKVNDGGERWVIGLQGIAGRINLRKLSHLHLCLCGVITRDAAVTVVMLPDTPFEALAQYRYSNGVTVSCVLQLEFSETNERVDLTVGEQLYHRMGEGLELSVEYRAKVIPITVEVPMDNNIVSFARRMIESESR